MMIDEVMELESEYFKADPAAYVESCYNTRALHRFGEFLGLLEVKRTESTDYSLASNYEVKAKPLVSQVVTFK